ncbi:MAG: hypothetical protein ACFFCX_15290, partial [Candidatus Sifarchaeia archaeon]
MAAKGDSRYHSATWYILSGIRKHPFLTIGALVLTVIASLFIALPFIVVGQAIDVLRFEGFNQNFISLTWMIVFIGAAYLALNFTAGVLWAAVITGWERDARQEL